MPDFAYSGILIQRWLPGTPKTHWRKGLTKSRWERLPIRRNRPVQKLWLLEILRKRHARQTGLEWLTRQALRPKGKCRKKGPVYLANLRKTSLI